MSVVVIVDLPATRTGKDELVSWLQEALHDTRAYDGCRGASLCIDSDNAVMVTIVERWETLDHYRKYDAWRAETGFMERVGPLLGADPGERHLEELAE
jgi:quinol monooxygenase YgiN